MIKLLTVSLNIIKKFKNKIYKNYMNIPLKKPVTFTPRRDFLVRKVRLIQSRIKRETNQIELDKLYEKLSDVNREIKEINIDPLTHEFCNIEPWAFECKEYDC
jgi:hypothetical protein